MLRYVKKKKQNPKQIKKELTSVLEAVFYKACCCHRYPAIQTETYSISKGFKSLISFVEQKKVKYLLSV